MSIAPITEDPRVLAAPAKLRAVAECVQYCPDGLPMHEVAARCDTSLSTAQRYLENLEWGELIYKERQLGHGRATFVWRPCTGPV